jgi:aspartyl/glutamyl-tRNA(Asn/Gln) amidotransferase C subunit
MASEIDAAQVRHIARLARLHLTDDEVERFQRELGEILVWFRDLQRVDTDGVAPMAHALPVTNVARDDASQPSLPARQALANAPQRDTDFFRVPRVLDPTPGT